MQTPSDVLLVGAPSASSMLDQVQGFTNPSKNVIQTVWTNTELQEKQAEACWWYTDNAHHNYPGWKSRNAVFLELFLTMGFETAMMQCFCIIVIPHNGVLNSLFPNN